MLAAFLVLAMPAEHTTSEVRITLTVESAQRYTEHREQLAPDAERVTIAATTAGSPDALHTVERFLVIDGSAGSAVAWTLVGDALSYAHDDTALVMRWPEGMSTGEALAAGRFLMAVQGWAYAGK